MDSSVCSVLHLHIRWASTYPHNIPHSEPPCFLSSGCQPCWRHKLSSFFLFEYAHFNFSRNSPWLAEYAWSSPLSEPWIPAIFTAHLLYGRLFFPGGSDGKESAHNAGSVPGSGRSPGIGNGNPLQYACLENYVDRGTWQAKVYGVAKSRTWLSH